MYSETPFREILEASYSWETHENLSSEKCVWNVESQKKIGKAASSERTQDLYVAAQNVHIMRLIILPVCGV